jgi:hypothetical protein
MNLLAESDMAENHAAAFRHPVHLALFDLQLMLLAQ